MSQDEIQFLLQAWETLRQRSIILQREAFGYGFITAANMLGADEHLYSQFQALLLQATKPAMPGRE